mmetsp:Transcript_63801/g.183264  ORF Transcript_63801/g.183264 Transcript_63801/m.183264 type:complete len:315 (+) Transcript_63801:905-1849(+)
MSSSSRSRQRTNASPAEGIREATSMDQAKTERPRESQAPKARCTCARKPLLFACSAKDSLPISGLMRSNVSANSRSAKRSARVSISASLPAASSFRASAFSVVSCSSGVAFGPMSRAKPGDSAVAAKKPTSCKTWPKVSNADSPPGSCRATRKKRSRTEQPVLRANATVASPACRAMSLPGMHCAMCIAVETPESTARRPRETTVLAKRISTEMTAPAMRTPAPAPRMPTLPRRSAREPPGNQRMAALRSSMGSTDCTVSPSHRSSPSRPFAAPPASCSRSPSAPVALEVSLTEARGGSGALAFGLRRGRKRVL